MQIFGELMGWDGEQTVRSDEATILLTVVALDLAMVAGTLWVVSWLARRRPTPADFGLRLTPWRTALGWTVAVYVGFIVVQGLVTLVTGVPEEQDIVVELKAEDSTAIIAGLAVMVCLVAPLAEEFFFRGFLLRVLQERTNVVIARDRHRMLVRAGASPERRLAWHDPPRPARNGAVWAVSPHVVAASVHHVARIP